ncbi:MAG: hypothetical protein R3F20_07445 [Planctomycetota bacterium]
MAEVEPKDQDAPAAESMRESAPAPEAAPSEETPTPEAPRRSGPGVFEIRLGRASRHGILRAAVAAAVLATAILAIIVIGDGSTSDTRGYDTTEATPAPKPLSSGEMLKVAEGARSEGDLVAARRAYQDALAPLGDGDVSERLLIYERLGEIEEQLGEPRLAEFYRNYAAELRQRLGTSIVIFGRAEDALREGRHDEALKLYRRFLLSEATLDENGRGFLDRARRRVAELWRVRAAAIATPDPDLRSEPRRWFDER